MVIKEKLEEEPPSERMFLEFNKEGKWISGVGLFKVKDIKKHFGKVLYGRA